MSQMRPWMAGPATKAAIIGGIAMIAAGMSILTILAIASIPSSETNTDGYREVAVMRAACTPMIPAIDAAFRDGVVDRKELRSLRRIHRAELRSSDDRMFKARAQGLEDRDTVPCLG